jgi:AAA+ ATPase superfamily predicted ATPase
MEKKREKSIFVGRAHELKLLQDLLQKKAASLVVLQGRRRIGKSRLVKEFAKSYRFLQFSGIPPVPGVTAQEERDLFSKQFVANQLPAFKAEDWVDLFSFLARETKTGRVVILFDEISWMATQDPYFLGKLKNAWDAQFKNNPQLIFILCGSVSTWIEENILKNTGFVGRLSLRLNLKELSLAESNQFLETIRFRGDAYEKLKILSVTGGVPRYLEEIKSNRLADENIKDLCFKPSGILFQEFDDVFVDIFCRKSHGYQQLVEALVSGSKEQAEISKYLDKSMSGHLSRYLLDLIQSGFVRRDFTWHIIDGRESKLSHYRLSDNYLRFYLKYILKNKNKIENNFFDDQALMALPGLDSMMGLQFENLVLNNRRLIFEKLHIYPEEVKIDNPFFQRPQTRRKGCQIDYLIQTKSNVLYVCEIKFSKQALKLDVVDEVKDKIKAFQVPKGFSVLPVLIHVNGVHERVEAAEYFSHIICFADLLK